MDAIHYLSNMANSWALFPPRLVMAPHFIKLSTALLFITEGVYILYPFTEIGKAGKGAIFPGLDYSLYEFLPTFFTAINPNLIFPSPTVNFL